MSQNVPPQWGQQPGQPAHQGQPGQPVQPGYQGQPGQPVQPGYQGQPVQPGPAGYPGQPGNPVQPGQPMGMPNGGVVPQPGGGGQGRIIVNLQGSIFTGTTPTVLVDRYPVRAKYGANEIAVPPGQHLVQVHANWMRKYGKAELPVEVGPGQTVEVFYVAPLSQWVSEGSIGLEKQKRKGTVSTMIAVVVASAAVIAVLAALG